MTNLTAFDRKWLPLVSDWTSPQQLAQMTTGNPRSAGGIAGGLGHCVRAGLAEWRVHDRVSEFRITDAGKAALSPNPGDRS